MSLANDMYAFALLHIDIYTPILTHLSLYHRSSWFHWQSRHSKWWPGLSKSADTRVAEIQMSTIIHEMYITKLQLHLSSQILYGKLQVLYMYFDKEKDYQGFIMIYQIFSHIQSMRECSKTNVTCIASNILQILLSFNLLCPSENTPSVWIQLLSQPIHFWKHSSCSSMGTLSRYW